MSTIFKRKSVHLPAFVLVCIFLMAGTARVAAASEQAKAAGAPAAARAGADSPVFSTELIFGELPDYPSHHGATLTELPNGDVMAAWYGGSQEKAKDVAILYSTLPRGGKWSEPAVLHDSPGLSDGNPVLYTDKSGRVWFFFVTMFGGEWTDCRIYVKTSDDGAKTWSAARPLRSDFGWMTRNRPIELKDGTFLLPIYNEKNWTPAFMASRDHGRTWELLARDIPVPGGAIQPAIAQLDDGAIFAMLRTGQAGGNIWQMESRDGGATWSRPERSSLPNPNSGIDMVRLTDGHLVLLYNNSPHDRTPLNVAVSEDGGKTWPYTRKLEKTYGEFSYPAVIQTSDGLIHVVYTYKRKSIKHAAFNEAWIISDKK